MGWTEMFKHYGQVQLWNVHYSICYESNILIFILQNYAFVSIEMSKKRNIYVHFKILQTLYA